MAGKYQNLVEVSIEFAVGSVGHLDLTMAVRMDWHEGFQVYGEYVSVLGKTSNPWYLRSSDTRLFQNEGKPLV